MDVETLDQNCTAYHLDQDGLYKCAKCKDGKFMAVGCLEPQFYDRMLEVTVQLFFYLNHPHLLNFFYLGF